MCVHALEDSPATLEPAHDGREERPGGGPGHPADLPILSVRETPDVADLPEGFDLASHWRRTQADFHARLHPEEALVRLSARGAARLTGAQARALTATGEPDPELPGWTRAVLPIESADHAEAQFLALATEAEVLSPPALRTRVGATLAAMAARYADGPRVGDTDAGGAPWRTRPRPTARPGPGPRS
ncbi:helix-turn-helix transcriptional regulator [Streptomyces sp. NBC_00122]|uniref:helix-turn-helix transcriptional regulator n=1 Tax=Streptomyces sp. NBC_00122 TaxID=2903623 RepID=UPI0032490D88